MEKVKLPREVAEAIESLRSMDFKLTNWDIVYAFANSKSGEYPALIEFANKEFDTFLQALVNGYEVDESPEDKLREYYNFCKMSCVGETEANIMTAIERTLNLLNIKIEGVNA